MMLKHVEEIVCKCGLRQRVSSSYIICVSCGNPLLLSKKTHPKCFVLLQRGVPVASRLLSEGDVVEDLIVYGKFEHPHSVEGHIVSGFVPRYVRSDTPNVRVVLFGKKAKVIALSSINKGEEIQIHDTTN